jgi:HAD superfamily hydrolase (TIGR01549 family)
MKEKLTVLQELRNELTGRTFTSGSIYKTYLFEGIAEKLRKRHPGRPPINTAAAERWYHNDNYPAVIITLQKHYAVPKNCLDMLDAVSHSYVLGIYSYVGALDERLRAVGISPALFTVRTCAEETGLWRPSFKVYQEMAKRMNMRAEKILVVGDSPEIDGAGASSAGMDFFQILSNKSRQAFIESWNRLSRILLGP